MKEGTKNGHPVVELAISSELVESVVEKLLKEKNAHKVPYLEH